MATLKLPSAYNFLNNNEWDWTVAQNTATTIVIVNDALGYRQVFTGSFSYDSFGGAHGTVRSTTFSHNGAIVYTATGMNDDAAVIQMHAQTTGDAQETLAYVLRNPDAIFGSAQADGLVAYAGNDTIDGGAGADVMLGGSGNDVYVVDNALDKVVETTTRTSGVDAGGTDLVKSSVDHTLAMYVEKLLLTGTGAIDGAGNGLANLVQGNGAGNVLLGAGGNDTLSGGGGGDTLAGGAGKDQLIGGAGADVFEYNAVADSGVGVSSADIIKDFAVGVDRINLSAIDANPLLAGNQAFTFIGTAMFGADATGQLRYTVNADAHTVTVWGSIDADPQAEFSIVLVGVGAVHNADFIR
jgi:Ca2+-binding RTX toxin-like protein